jgi:hypothetical protein
MRLLLLLALLVPMQIFAQIPDSVESRKFQITFAYPLGSNWTNSMKYENNFSFNTIYGLNGGVNGFEFGSVLNYNKGNVNGIQFSGVININSGKTRGLQFSGVVNVNSGETEGLQIGVVNYTKKLKGVQLGVVNVLSDGETGIPVGIFNFVKNGFYEFELTAGELIHTTLNFKMGVERFYTIYKAGYVFNGDKAVYSSGMGLGGSVLLANKHRLNIDLSSNYINVVNDWQPEANILSKLDLNYKYNFTDKFALVAGPSLNVYYCKDFDNQEYAGLLEVPYSIYKNEKPDSKLYTWIGFNAGLALRL